MRTTWIIPPTDPITPCEIVTIEVSANESDSDALGRFLRTHPVGKPCLVHFVDLCDGDLGGPA